ncbi:MAG: ferritin-like domain-containing protein [Bryobacterales bacterium]|nr:ferritin-like domain-containing protein [Bryobacterales bacterium]
MESLRDLYISELRDVLDAERQIVKALPEMIRACSAEECRSAFEEHLEVTREQVKRLEQVFDSLGQKASSRKCAGMRGIIEEGKEILEQDASGPVKDAALIAAAQRVEHYEIAAYGTLCAYAKELDFQDQLELLLETLQEEKDTDEKLTGIAENIVNVEAVRKAG